MFEEDENSYGEGNNLSFHGNSFLTNSNSNSSNNNNNQKSSRSKSRKEKPSFAKLISGEMMMKDFVPTRSISKGLLCICCICFLLVAPLIVIFGRNHNFSHNDDVVDVGAGNYLHQEQHGKEKDDAQRIPITFHVEREQQRQHHNHHNNDQQQQRENENEKSEQKERKKLEKRHETSRINNVKINKDVNQYDNKHKGKTSLGKKEDFLTEVITVCNAFALNSTGIDHKNATNPQPYDPNEKGIVYGHRLGPTRASHAMAIIHMALFEAVIAIVRKYKSALPDQLKPKHKSRASLEAALVVATHTAVLNLYPTHTLRCSIFYNQQFQSFSHIEKSKIEEGIAVGKAAAEAVIRFRENDKSNQSEVKYGVNYFPPIGVGLWQPDPKTKNNVALGAYWSTVQPFVMQSASQFRCPAPPKLDSLEYAIAFDEVRALGGDGNITYTVRSEEQTKIGLFHAYDGLPSLCAPPRFFNQMAMKVLNDITKITGIELLRHLAMLNIGMADAAIASWESKYFYSMWRPCTGIPNADLDGNDLTVADKNYTPYGAPSSNEPGHKNFNPPFPSYPSGHATFSGMIGRYIQLVLGHDNCTFSFESDEFDGFTIDNVSGLKRDKYTRWWTSLNDFMWENAMSRIYLGIHWSFDKKSGIDMGSSIAETVHENLYKKI